MNRIDLPYSFTQDEEKIIKAYFFDYNDWDKAVFQSIKKNIISHLRTQQNNLCCYCKKELGFDLKDVDIEHVLPKSKYSSFTFVGKNLALSCPACNTIKGSKEVSTHQYKKYPSNSNNILIVHPHFDKYFDHIEIINRCIFSALSKKGSETITLCELYRLRNVEELAKDYSEGNSDISKFIKMLRNSSSDDLDHLKEAVKELLST